MANKLKPNQRLIQIMGSSEKRDRLLKQWKELVGQGNDTFEVKKQLQQLILGELKDLPFEVDVKISCATDCCEHCNTHADIILSLEEAYEKMPIPNINCTGHAGCRCHYTPITRRNKQGRLILK